MPRSRRVASISGSRFEVQASSADLPVTRFIVNADDLGGSTAINAAISAAIADGVVTSTSILANGPAFDEAVVAARATTAVSFAVHLNLTDFAPVRATTGLAPLLSEDGVFSRQGLHQARWSKALLRGVVDEWSAQVERVLAAGLIVSHLDSHEHVHTLPGLFPALKAIQRRFAIRRVRTTWSVYERARLPSRSLRWKKRVWHAALRTIYRTRTTDEFSDFLMFLRAVREGTYAPATWPLTVELMVHPNGDPVGNAPEAQALRGDWLRSLPCGGRLTSYAEI